MVHPRLVYALAGVLLALVIASAATLFLRHRHPERDYRELSDRVRSWWYMVALFTFAMLVSRTISLVFFAFVSFLALKE